MKRISLRELVKTRPDKSSLFLIIDSSFKRDRDSAFIILEDNYYEMNEDHRDIIKEISKDNYFQLREFRQGINTEESDLRFVAGHIIGNQAIIDLRTVMNYQISDVIEILLSNSYERIFLQDFDNKNLLKEVFNRS